MTCYKEEIFGPVLVCLNVPTLDDVIDPTESAPRDRQEHAKAPMRLNDDELEHRTEQERAEVREDAEQ